MNAKSGLSEGEESRYVRKLFFNFFTFYLSLYSLLLYNIKSYTMTDQSLTRTGRVNN
jgi:hypothetical protein